MIQIIMPLAGDGLRFKKAGYPVIKPIIDVDGKPMFTLPLSSLPLADIEHHITFVIKKNDNQNSVLSNTINAFYPQADIIFLDAPTNGPLETITPVLQSLPPDDPVIILDCDFLFESTDFNNYLNKKNQKHSSILYFNSSKSHFSYGSIGLDGTVIRTAEKNVISNNAIAGVYFFHSNKSLLKIAQTTIDQITNDPYKYYISPLYNLLIQQQEKVISFKLNSYQSVGTPSELQLYLSTIAH